MDTIPEQVKIPLMSLGDKIDSKELTVNQAYNTAVKDLGYEGAIGDFIDMMKHSKLIKSDNEPVVTSAVEPVSIPVVEKSKIVQFYSNKYVKIAVVLGAGFYIYKSFNK